MRKMSKNLNQRNGKLRKKSLERELKRIIPVLIQGYHPQRIILFGSLATGKIDESSDIDLAVIRPCRKRFLERIQEVLFLIKPKVGVDVLVYTPREFENKIKEGAYFFTEELQEKGKLIYEKK